MKFIAVLFVVVIVNLIALKCQGNTIPIRQQIIITQNRCLSIVGITEENRKRIVNYDFPDTQDTYLYIRCVVESLQLWTDINGIDELIKELLEKLRSEIVDVVKECNEEWTTIENPDSSIYNTVDCITANPNFSGVWTVTTPTPTEADVWKYTTNTPGPWVDEQVDDQGV